MQKTLSTLKNKISNTLIVDRENHIYRCHRSIFTDQQLFDFEMKHIYEVISLADNSTNKRINLPHGMVAENIYGDIYLKFKEVEKKENIEIILNKDQLENNIISYDDYRISFVILNNKNNIEFSNNVLIKYFDYNLYGKNLFYIQDNHLSVYYL